MNMKNLVVVCTLLVLCMLLFSATSHCQQPQTQTAPLYGVNSKYTNGIGPGYAPTAGSGLTLNVGKGTANCSGSLVEYAGGTLTMTNSTTNYVYLNAASACIPASNTSSFASTDIWVAKVTTSGGVITAIDDVRTMQVAPGTGVPASVAYEAGYYVNETVTGTVTNQPVIIESGGVNANKVKKATSANYQQGWNTGIIGICVSGCSTSGNALIVWRGTTNCVFDNAANQGDMVDIGSTGLCHADGLAGLNENPETHAYIGKVHTTIGGAGTTLIDLKPVQDYGNIGQGPGLAPYILTGGSATQFPSSSPFYLDSTSPASAAAPALNLNTSPLRLKNPSGIFFVDLYSSSLGASAHDVLLDLQTHGWPGAFRIKGAHYGVPDTVASQTGTVSVDDTNFDAHDWTLSGSTTISTVTNANVGHLTQWKICQDGSGGHTFTASMIINMPSISTTASACTFFITFTEDATHLYAPNGPAGSGTVTSVGTGSGLTGGPVTTTGTIDMTTAQKTRTCAMIIGADNASSALADADIAPQGRQCWVPYASTVVEVDVAADAGTPNVIVRKNTAGSGSNLLSSALATASAGGIACSNAGGTTGLDGATTCSATLQNTSIAAGAYLETISATAGGTAKRMSIFITYTVN